MTTDSLLTLRTFTEDNMPTLDVVTLGALELLSQKNLPKLDIPYKHPIVVGSGNAEVAGRIIFESVDAIFASESTVDAKLEIESVDGVVLLSASGSKHAPIIANKAREKGLPVTLVTNNEENPTKEAMADYSGYAQFVYPKNREPYTYNTSTYMGMILGGSGESASEIEAFIEEYISTITFPDFSQYQKYYLIVPPHFSGITSMLQTKFIELFGREIARDVSTSELMKHATTVVPSKELFISFGDVENVWGEPEDRLHIPLPNAAGYGAMMAIGYYVIGQIQKEYSHYFQDNIVEYCKRASESFRSSISPIVE